MLPIINLDDEKFDDIIEKAINMIANVYPEWTDYNDHDPGITFLNLFAWFKEMQQYHLNQVGQRNQLKYLKLLGMKLSRKRPAGTFVFIKDMQQEIILPKGTWLTAGDIRFETMELEVVVKEKIVKLISCRNDKTVEFDYTPNLVESKMRFYMFGTQPLEGNEFCIGFNGPLTKNVVHNIYIDIVNNYSVKRNEIIDEMFYPLANLKYEYYSEKGWKSLKVIKDDTHEFIRSGRVYFELEESMELMDCAYWIKIILVEEDYDVPPILQGISMNMIPVHQVETMTEFEDFEIFLEEDKNIYEISMNTALAQLGNHEIFMEEEFGFRKINNEVVTIVKTKMGARFLIPMLYKKPINTQKVRIVNYDRLFSVSRNIGMGDGFPNQKFQLNKSNIIYESFGIMVENEMSPGNFQLWNKVDDFDNSDPEDRHYILDEETGTIYFGNCENGRAPEGTIEIIRMEESFGLEGNVKSEKINQFVVKEIQATVINYDNASKGTNKETIQGCMNRFKYESKTITRAVTYEDYEKLTLQTPGLMISNVKAIPISQLKKQNESLDENCVTVVIQPFSTNKMQKLSQAYQRNVLQQLNNKRMVGTKVKVISPEYVGVTIFAEVEIVPHYQDAQSIIREAVEDYLGKETWDFGNTVLYSNLYGIIDTLDCVIQIQSLSIDAQGRGISRNMNGDILIPANGLVYLKEAIYSISTAN